MLVVARGSVIVCDAHAQRMPEMSRLEFMYPVVLAVRELSCYEPSLT